ncbi:MAG TPA: lactate racemase domain-containing protein [Planctomycetaceae bacterium]|nr:lactate racemase domain-containing protein [Planctomycetaceae bacterium]
MTVQLRYGRTGLFTCDVELEHVLAVQLVPPALADVGAALRSALAKPIDFPPFARCIAPGDHLVLAVDRHTPEAPRLIAELWRILAEQQVSADDVLILQPAALGSGPLSDPRTELPADVRERIGWKIHDPTDASDEAYLATTAAGERIYLARELTDADLVVTVGEIAFDPVLGYRGTNSVLFPGLSSSAAIAKVHGQGQQELGPDDERSLRATVDEIGWLLGTQFSVQVIAGAGAGASAVLAGFDQSVFQRGRQVLAERWTVQLPERPELVVVAIEADAAGHGWNQLGAALATARNLVAKGGKVLVLSEINAELDAGMELLRDAHEPRDAIKPLRKQAPPDLIAATQLASATDWAHIYLLSKLDPELVDDLFMTPLDDEREAQRLVGTTENCALLGGAQHIYGHINSDE